MEPKIIPIEGKRHGDTTEILYGVSIDDEIRVTTSTRERAEEIILDIMEVLTCA